MVMFDMAPTGNQRYCNVGLQLIKTSYSSANPKCNYPGRFDLAVPPHDF